MNPSLERHRDTYYRVGILSMVELYPEAGHEWKDKRQLDEVINRALRGQTYGKIDIQMKLRRGGYPLKRQVEWLFRNEKPSYPLNDYTPTDAREWRGTSDLTEREKLIIRYHRRKHFPGSLTAIFLQRPLTFLQTLTDEDIAPSKKARAHRGLEGFNL